MNCFTFVLSAATVWQINGLLTIGPMRLDSLALQLSLRTRDANVSIVRSKNDALQLYVSDID